MGYMMHHAIIATFCKDIDRALMKRIYRRFNGADGGSFSVSEVTINNYQTVSLVLPPDGSKKGWEDSDTGDALRDELVSVLREHKHTSWVEVSFGGDDPQLHTKVLRHGGETYSNTDPKELPPGSFGEQADDKPGQGT